LTVCPLQMGFCLPKEKALPWLRRAPPDSVRHALRRAPHCPQKLLDVGAFQGKSGNPSAIGTTTKREAMQKFAEYVKGRGGGIEADDESRSLTHWIQ